MAAFVMAILSGEIQPTAVACAARWRYPLADSYRQEGGLTISNLSKNLGCVTGNWADRARVVQQEDQYVVQDILDNILITSGGEMIPAFCEKAVMGRAILVMARAGGHASALARSSFGAPRTPTGCTGSAPVSALLWAARPALICCQH